MKNTLVRLADKDTDVAVLDADLVGPRAAAWTKTDDNVPAMAKVLVDFAKTLRSRGVGRTEAIITAGRTRLRPIMMTTLAMIFGMVPLSLAIGAGAEMRAPMARAVIGGLITSTFLTLLVVPVMYSVLDDAGAWIHKRWKKES